jgi:competence protein ComEC
MRAAAHRASIEPFASLVLVVDDSAAPGTYAKAHLADCAGSVSMSVEHGTADAGATVSAHGTVVLSQRGSVVQHADLHVIHGPPMLARIRAAAGRAIDRTFRSDAPLVRALLIADRHELSPDVRDRFAAAGLAHVLAIAGLHIGIIALAIGLALELGGVDKRRAAIVTAAAIAVYVAIIGAPVPAVRSAAMLGALTVSRSLQRPTSRWAIVALGALEPVFDPRAVLEVGYQLSVVGVLAMIASARLGNRIGVKHLPTVVRSAALTMLAATVATIATAPIVAWVFGRVSVIAPLSNVAAVPLVIAVQPMLVCGLILSPIQPLAALVADAAHPLLASLDWLASTAAAVPYGSLYVAPTVATAAIAGVMSVAVIVACASKRWVPPAIAAAASAALLVWLPVVGETSGNFAELHMIDVGQGDAIALRTPHGHWILFDAGRAWKGGDAGRSTIVPYIGRRGGTLDLFVLSHPHTDHVGGAVSVFRALHPAAYVDAAFPGPADAYRASLEAARTEHIQWRRAHPGDSLSIDGVSLTFLAPDSAWTASLADPNLASVVTLVRFGEVRMLLMGDAERAEERWLTERDWLLLRADILKVGHHGSGTSSNETFLRAVQPRVALVSVGAGNSYHLPTPSVMRALAANGAEVLRTDLLGTIVAKTDGHRLFMETSQDSWEVSLTPPLRAP